MIYDDESKFELVKFDDDTNDDIEDIYDEREVIEVESLEDRDDERFGDDIITVG